MTAIERIDPAFDQALQTRPGDVFYDVRTSPFSWHGLLPGRYERLPEALHLSEHLAGLSAHTSGGRVRFATDAAYAHVCVRLGRDGFMSHMPLTGSSGVDVLIDDQRPVHNIRPAVSVDGRKQRAYAATVPLFGQGLRTVTLYLPLYDAVEAVQVGLPRDAALAAPRAYTLPSPIVFYGSSITQGGCACRASGGHCALLARFLDADFTNLGFSGNARGEPEMARYIAALPMSAFVLDYDHNAPNVQHLAQTHAPFFRIVRKARPDLPILLLSSPNTDTLLEASERRAIVRATYEQALAAGDRHVFFVPGDRLFGDEHRECCRVDASHPNDLGFFRMAEAILPTLRAALDL